MICYAMVKPNKNKEIRKFQLKLKLNIRTIPTRKKCFKLLFKNGEVATCSYS